MAAVPGPCVVLALEDPRWHDFVRHAPDAGPFHDPRWAALLGECYRFPAFALALQGPGGRLLAGLPVLAVKGGRRWVALPFSDSCSLLRDPSLDLPDALRALDAARRAAGVERLDVRAPLTGVSAYPGTRSYQHVLTLTGDDAALRGRIASAQLAAARAAERAGVRVRVGQRESDLTRAFYDLQVTTRHRLGVPAQPRRYFSLLWRRVLATGAGRLLLAEHQGRVVAGNVVLHGGSTAVYKYSASDPSAGPTTASQLLLWEAVSRAREEACTRFDLGSTSPGDEGLRRYKQRWSDVEELRRWTVLADRQPETASGEVPDILRRALRRGPRAFVPALGALLYRRTA